MSLVMLPSPDDDTETLTLTLVGFPGEPAIVPAAVTNVVGFPAAPSLNRGASWGERQAPDAIQLWSLWSGASRTVFVAPRHKQWPQIRADIGVSELS